MRYRGDVAGEDDAIDRCSRLILSDLFEGMLESAKEKLMDYPKIEYCMIDIEDIPFPDSEFDVVIANMMLYHVSDLSKALTEVQRVLKDKGTFIVPRMGKTG